MGMGILDFRKHNQKVGSGLWRNCISRVGYFFAMLLDSFWQAHDLQV